MTAFDISPTLPGLMSFILSHPLQAPICFRLAMCPARTPQQIKQLAVKQLWFR
jgi:hypothetical protein